MSNQPMFAEEESARLAYLSVAREVKRFKELLDEGLDFNDAFREVFGDDEEREDQTPLKGGF